MQNHFAYREMIILDIRESSFCGWYFCKQQNNNSSWRPKFTKYPECKNFLHVLTFTDDKDYFKVYYWLPYGIILNLTLRLWFFTWQIRAYFWAWKLYHMSMKIFASKDWNRNSAEVPWIKTDVIILWLLRFSEGSYVMLAQRILRW